VSADIQKPLRTCAGCRQISAQADLVRLVVVDGTLTLDIDRRLPGRGAYLHLSAECGSVAVARRAFNRSFRMNLSVSALPAGWESLISPNSPNSPTPHGA
jgi:predicted RNA-binding protein YlxR (DUF448 family)